MQLTTLIIDDSKIQELLTFKMVSRNPKEGLLAANILKPDVIILDIEMPELDGFAVLENLNYDYQVILYSTSSEFAFNTFKYDYVKDYMTKPLKKPGFEKSIKKIIENQILDVKKKMNLGTYFYSENLSLNY